MVSKRSLANINVHVALTLIYSWMLTLSGKLTMGHIGATKTFVASILSTSPAG